MLLAPVYPAHLKAVFIDEAHCVDMWGGGKEPFRKATGVSSACLLSSLSYPGNCNKSYKSAGHSPLPGKGLL